MSLARADLNGRQRWILAQLHQGVKPRRAMIELEFDVTDKQPTSIWQN